MLSSIRANVNSFDCFSGVGRRVASCNQNTISTILGCFLGVISAVISVLAIVVFVLFFHERKRSIALNYRQGDVQ